MQSRLEANLPGLADAPSGISTGGTLPPQVADGFAAGMAQSILLPACVMGIALIASLFLGRYDKTTAP